MRVIFDYCPEFYPIKELLPSIVDKGLAMQQEQESMSRMRRSMECRMFFPTSGHRGFDLIPPPSGVSLPDLDTVRAMLQRESQLR